MMKAEYFSQRKLKAKKTEMRTKICTSILKLMRMKADKEFLIHLSLIKITKKLSRGLS